MTLLPTSVYTLIFSWITQLVCHCLFLIPNSHCHNVAEMQSLLHVLELNSRIIYFQYTALFEWFSPGLDSIMNCEYNRFLVQLLHNSTCILQETVYAHITVYAFFVSS
jgi:hypothetical protein